MPRTSGKGQVGNGRKSRAGGATRRRTLGQKTQADAAQVEPNYWLDDYVPYQLYRVTNKLNARLLKRLKRMRINTSQWRVLSV
ncbi:MAG TPA: hypothetical protein VF193_07185, partial [Steroidobacter sp.]